nr:uncharacterized protein LOC109192699 isoform X2 [Ipomoea batatas]GME21036.1 uncharacterized protein LOC109192699 isoform X2 [Ipomoea batatas]
MFGNNFLVYLHCLVVSEVVREWARMEEAEDGEARDADPITDLTISWFVGGVEVFRRGHDEVLELRRRRHRNRAPSPTPSQQSYVTDAIAAELRHRRHRSRAPSPSPLQQSSVAVAIAADRTPPSVTAKSFTWKQFDLEIKQLSRVEGTGMNIKLESLRKENMDLLEKTESLKQELGSVKS